MSTRNKFIPWIPPLLFTAAGCGCFLINAADASDNQKYIGDGMGSVLLLIGLSLIIWNHRKRCANTKQTGRTTSLSSQQRQQVFSWFSPQASINDMRSSATFQEVVTQARDESPLDEKLLASSFSSSPPYS